MGVVFKSILYELFLRQKNNSDIKRARKQKKATDCQSLFDAELI